MSDHDRGRDPVDMGHIDCYECEKARQNEASDAAYVRGLRAGREEMRGEIEGWMLRIQSVQAWDQEWTCVKLLDNIRFFLNRPSFDPKHGNTADRPTTLPSTRASEERPDHPLAHSDRDWTEDFPHENGNYSRVCAFCDKTFLGHKRRVGCKLCAGKQAAPSATSEEGEA